MNFRFNFNWNLISKINENELKNRFGSKGDITDIRLNKDKRHAIIGYKDTNSAEEAISYFDKTFILTSKIRVQLGAVGLASIKKSFIKKSAEEIEEEKKAKEELKIKKKQQKKEKLSQQFDELKDDPEFTEFLKLQRNVDSGKGKHIWSNDLEIDEKINEEIPPQSDDNQSQKEIHNHEKSSENVDNKVLPKELHEFTVKMRGLPYKVKKRQIKEFFEPLKPLSLRIPPKLHGIAYVSFKSQKDLNEAMIKHRGFFNGHRIELLECKTKKISNNDSNGDNNNNENSKAEPKWKNAEPAEEPVGESGRIYVRNLSYATNEDELKALFEKYGSLSEFHLPIDSQTKQQKGFAFVTYVFPEHAVKAFSELDKTDFQGRLLHLIPARAKPANSKPHFVVTDPNQSSFKKSKQQEKKDQAQSAHQWNSLFISSNAIADIMAKKFKIKKSELLTNSKKKDSIAVRMALGETQIVNEMRRFLLENGVHLKSFANSNCPRSKTVILVKNLPADTKPEEIREMFEKFGLILRVVLPPNGVTAVVEMQERNEAKKAFKSLAYINFKHVPLYLEWAPNDVFREKELNSEQIEKEIEELKELEKNSGKATNNSETKEEPSETAVEKPSDGSQNKLELEPEEDTTLFVKNLNFNTTDEDFGEHFRKCGQIYSAKIAYKKGSDRPLSMGYGFVQFLYQKSAQKALKQLQHSVLDGHTLELKISNRTTNA